MKLHTKVTNKPPGPFKIPSLLFLYCLAMITYAPLLTSPSSFYQQCLLFLLSFAEFLHKPGNQEFVLPSPNTFPIKFYSMNLWTEALPVVGIPAPWLLSSHVSPEKTTPIGPSHPNMNQIPTTLPHHYGHCPHQPVNSTGSSVSTDF